MKNILVTGANGFIAVRLIDKLRNVDKNVVPYTSDKGDISSIELKDTDIDHVFHLAAKTYVPDSWSAPLEFYKTNIQGTINILELCRKNKCGLTFISTYVYGTPLYKSIDESHPVRAMSPYHQSKIVAEEMCKYYSDTYGVPITIIRPFNIYGPFQDSKFVIPTILNQILSNDQPIVEVMDLNPRRDYLYIDDFINALLLTIGRQQSSTYNVGSGISVSVEEVIMLSMELNETIKPYRSRNEQRMNEISDFVADIGKIKIDLGWEPQHSISEGLRKTINMMKGRSESDEGY